MQDSDSFFFWRRPAGLPVATLLGLFVVLAICGGSSRPDVWGLLLLRPVFLIALLLLLRRDDMDLRGVRPLFILLGLFAAWMLIQLVPLPNDWWRLMPGHAQFIMADTLVGAKPWRPISLVPEITLNAFLSLLVPLTVLLALAATGSAGRRLVPAIILALVIAGSLFVMVQVITGSGPIYNVPHPSPSGLFANRNHQALLLAIGIPYATLWATQREATRLSSAIRHGIGGAAVILAAGMIVVTGSRAGLLLGAIGAGALPFVVPARYWRDRQTRLAVAGAVLLLVLFVATIMYFNRAESVARLIAMQGVAKEGRVEFLPVTAQILRDFLPFGAGTSVFDPLYRVYEPDWALHVGTFNRAHNDWLDLALGGGIVAVLLLAAFIVVVLRGFFRTVAQRDGRGWVIAGGTALVQIGVASMVDYPLRTPLMAGILVIVTVTMLVPPVASGDAER